MRAIKSGAFAVALAAAGLFGVSAAGAQDMTFFRIASGSAGGTYFPVAGLLAQVISNPPGAWPCAKGGNCGMPGLVAVAQSAPGSMANVSSLHDDEFESAFIQADVTYWAYTGKGPFAKSGPHEKLCVLASLYPEHVHVVAREGAEIERVKDLRRKSVDLGLPESGALVGARLVLDAYGLKEDRDFKPTYQQTATAARLLAAGRLDAFITVMGYPGAAIAELARGRGAKLLPVTGKPRARLVAAAPFYAPGIIPGGTYAGNTADIETVAVHALWVSRTNLHPDLHYGVVKGLFGNEHAPKIFANGHVKARSITLESAGDGVPIPFCAGAARFYEEVGADMPPATP